MSPGRQIDERRSAAVSSSAEAALTIDTENFTADVTRESKRTTFALDFQMRNYTRTLNNREGVDLLYVYIPYSYILYKRMYIHSKWHYPPLYFTNITDIAFVYKTTSTLVTHKYDFYPISDWNTVFLVFYFRLNHIELWSYFYISHESFFSRRHRCNIYIIYFAILDQTIILF